MSHSIPTAEPPIEASSQLRRYNDIRELIASIDNPTPIVRLNKVAPFAIAGLYLKLEWFNPFGSIKDRTAQYLIRGLQERGELDGKTIIEPTSGNTGIALAALAALLEIPIEVTIPSAVPEEKKILLRMLGAQVWDTPDDLCPINHPKDGAIALARSFVEGAATKDRYVMPNQYENPDNVRAHYETTGPEIWRQTNGKIGAFIAGYGTCGTITGTAKFLKEQNPEIKIIAIEPQKGHHLPGLKNLTESKAPGILDRSLIDEVVKVDDEPAYEMTKRLFREEGLIVGPSTGAIVHAASELKLGADTIAVAISPDGGFKYASYYKEILGDEGNPEG
jgi:cysteine synthase